MGVTVMVIDGRAPQGPVRWMVGRRTARLNRRDLRYVSLVQSKQEFVDWRL
jgi:hypothetical protein